MSYRRTSYASVAAGNAPLNQLLFSPPRGAAQAYQHETDPDITPPHHSHYTAAGRRGPAELEGGSARPPSARALDTDALDFGMETALYFVPSYLRRSRYVEGLEMAWKSNALSRERGSKDGQGGALGSRKESQNNLAITAANMGLPAANFTRGTMQDVIECLSRRQNPVLDSKGFPTRWSETDKCVGLEIVGSSGGSEVKYQGTARSPDDAAAVRSDVKIPREVGLYYYEVTILSRGKEGLIAIGFSSAKPSLNRLPGWEPESWGYHGDDGFSFACSATGKVYGPKFSSLDVIGCGINFRTNTAFFTKNGIFLGEAFGGLKAHRALYPSVGIKKPGEHLKANFGQAPFVYDIDAYMEREKRQVQNEISSVDTSISPLRPGLDETETVHQLIEQYLAHEGFIEAADEFKEETRREKATLLPETGNVYDSREGDDSAAVYRQKIRAAILEGDIDKAFKYINMWFPDVMDQGTNREIYFRLRCRKFIEMILRSYEMQSRVGSPTSHSDDGFSNGTNGHSGASLEADGNTMDVDGGLSSIANGKQEVSEAVNISNEGLKGVPTFAESRSSTLLHNDLLNDAIQYGRELQAEFSHDNRPEVKKALTDTFALIAYNDARQSELADMMEGRGRVEIAEQVNGAILVSLGKPRSALLEKLCAQTQVLLDMVGQDGGIGATINLTQDYLR